MKNLSLTCIRCPIGCSLEISLENGIVQSVSGNECKKGIDYANTESISPMRSLSSTVLLLGGEEKLLPVKTSLEIPKDKVFLCMQAIKKITAHAPVSVGDVIAQNLAGTGSDLIATRQC